MGAYSTKCKPLRCLYLKNALPPGVIPPNCSNLDEIVYGRGEGGGKMDSEKLEKTIRDLLEAVSKAAKIIEENGKGGSKEHRGGAGYIRSVAGSMMGGSVFPQTEINEIFSELLKTLEGLCQESSEICQEFKTKSLSEIDELKKKLEEFDKAEDELGEDSPEELKNTLSLLKDDINEIIKTIKCNVDMTINALQAKSEQTKEEIAEIKDNSSQKVRSGTKQMESKVSNIVEALKKSEKLLNGMYNMSNELNNKPNLNYEKVLGQLKEMISAAENGATAEKLNKMYDNIRIFYSNVVGTTGKGEMLGGSLASSGNDRRVGDRVLEQENIRRYIEPSKSPFEKKISERTKMRKEYAREFVRAMSTLLKSHIASLRSIARVFQTGSQGDLVDKFIYSLSVIPDIQKKNSYWTLMGFLDDVGARTYRDNFILSLENNNSVIDEILASSTYSNLHTNLKTLKSLNTDILTLVKNTIARVRDPKGLNLANVVEQSGAGDDDDFDPAVGSFEIDESIPDITGAAQKFSKAIDEVYYRNRLGKIKQNFTQTEKEINEFNKGYSDIIRNSISYQRKKLEIERDEIMRELVQNVMHFKNEDVRRDFKEKYGEIIRKMYDVKINFYRTVEVIELYLKDFTQTFLKNLDALKSSTALVKQIEINSEWFNDKCGDKITELYGTFPAALGGMPAIDIIDNTLSWNPPQAKGDAAGNPFFAIHPTTKDEDLTTEAIKISKDVLSNCVVFKNFLHMFFNVGKVIGGDELIKKCAFTPRDIYLKIHEYIQFSAFILGYRTKYLMHTDSDRFMFCRRTPSATPNLYTCNYPAGIADVPGDIAKWLNPFKYGDRVGEPYTSTKTKGETADADLIVSYPAIGTDREVLILYSLRMAGVYKHITHGNAGDKTHLRTGPDNTANNFLPQSVPNAPIAGNVSFTYSAMLENYEDSYLFVDLMKSMFSKILNVIGIYNMMERPEKLVDTGKFQNVRMILGGSDQEYPVVDPSLLELYYRLPMVIEFYSKIFKSGFDDFTKDGSKSRRDIRHAITLLPDFEGKFGNLIRFIFDKLSYGINEVPYSERDVIFIIREVNHIASMFQNKSNITQEVVRELINEINRRYGIYKKKDIDALNKFRNQSIDDSSVSYPDTSNTDDVDVSILDGEDTDFREGKTPSDAVDYKPKTEYGIGNEDPILLGKYRQIVFQFRDRVSKMLEKNLEDTFIDDATKPGYGFRSHMKVKNTIEDARQELIKETSVEKRFKVVHNLIMTTDKFTRADNARTLMYHETVNTGLSVLISVSGIIAKFIENIKSFEKKFEELYKAVTDIINNPGGGAAAAINHANIIGKDIVLKSNIYATSNINTASRNSELNTFDIAKHTITVAEFTVAKTDEERRGLVFTRLVDYNRFIGCLFDTISQHCVDLNDMVSLNVRSGEIFVEYSHLERHVFDLIKVIRKIHQNGRHAVPDEKWRNHLQDLIQLEKELYDGMLKGQTTKYGKRNDNSIGEANKVLAYFSKLIHQEKNNLKLFDFGYTQVGNMLPRTDMSYSGVGYPQVFKSMDLKDIGVNIINLTDIVDLTSGGHYVPYVISTKDKEGKVVVEFKSPKNMLSVAHLLQIQKQTFNSVENIIPARGIYYVPYDKESRMYDLESGQSFKYGSFASFANQLTASVIYTLMDANTSKIYKKLIEPMSRGVLYKIVADPFNNGYNDMFSFDTLQGNLQNPDTLKSVLLILYKKYQSLVDIVNLKINAACAAGAFNVAKTAIAAKFAHRGDIYNAYKQLLITSFDDYNNDPAISGTANILGANTKTRLTNEINNLNPVGADINTLFQYITTFNPNPGNALAANLAAWQAWIQNPVNAQKINEYNIAHADITNANFKTIMEFKYGLNTHVAPTIIKESFDVVFQSQNIADIKKKFEQTIKYIYRSANAIDLYTEFENPGSIKSKSLLDAITTLSRNVVYNVTPVNPNTITIPGKVDIVQNLLYLDPTYHDIASDISAILNILFQMHQAIEKPKNLELSIILDTNTTPKSILKQTNLDGILLLGAPVERGAMQNAFSDNNEGRSHPCACVDPNHFLLRSLALVINRIMNNKDVKVGNAMFISDNIEEIHPEIKERYRANLPVFIKLVNAEIAKIEHFKKFTSGLKLDDVMEHTRGIEPLKVINTTASGYFSSLIDNISRYLYDMKSALEGTYKELNDRPKYFEMYSNYIEEYRRVNNALPLMLPSMSTHYLAKCNRVFRTEDDDPSGLFPSIQNGTDVFKFLYGTRGFLHTYKNKLNVDDIPFVKELVEMYNTASTNKEIMSMDEYLGFLNTMRPLLQYCYDTMYYRNRLISSNDCIKNSICQVKDTPPSITAVTEVIDDTNRKQKGLEIVNNLTLIKNEIVKLKTSNDREIAKVIYNNAAAADADLAAKAAAAGFTYIANTGRDAFNRIVQYTATIDASNALFGAGAGNFLTTISNNLNTQSTNATLGDPDSTIILKARIYAQFANALLNLLIDCADLNKIEIEILMSHNWINVPKDLIDKRKLLTDRIDKTKPNANPNKNMLQNMLDIISRGKPGANSTVSVTYTNYGTTNFLRAPPNRLIEYNIAGSIINTLNSTNAFNENDLKAVLEAFNVMGSTQLMNNGQPLSIDIPHEITIPPSSGTYAIHVANDGKNTTTLNKVVFTVESIHRNEKIKEIVDHIGGTSYYGGQFTSQRNENITRNILELGVSPINIYALMREIPLSFIYNYAYTADKYFDNIVKGETYQRSYLKKKRGGMYGGALADEPNFATFLKDPYCECDEATMFASIRKDFATTGKDDVFMTKQLFNKSLNKLNNVIDKSRFNTTFMRNIIYVVLLHRALRHSLHNELLWHDQIAHEQEIINPDITEDV
jgi:hypothetical protein